MDLRRAHRFAAVPDRTGALDDIVLGYDTLDGYVEKNPTRASIVGRCANRLARGTSRWTGRLPAGRDNGVNHLHGGHRGFDKVAWQDNVGGVAAVTLRRRTSPDGEEGYPGNLMASLTKPDRGERARHRLPRPNRQDDDGQMSSTATFNLRVKGRWTCSGTSSRSLPTGSSVESTQIPTGELAP